VTESCGGVRFSCAASSHVKDWEKNRDYVKRSAGIFQQFPLSVQVEKIRNFPLNQEHKP
jgi:hypothetical protein